MIISIDFPRLLSFSVLPVKSNFQVDMVKMEEEKRDDRLEGNSFAKRNKFWRRSFEEENCGKVGSF